MSHYKLHSVQNNLTLSIFGDQITKMKLNWTISEQNNLIIFSSSGTANE